VQEVLISFCIPTFNRSDKLSRSVISIVDSINYSLQQNTNFIFEIIISDNNSTDNTQDIFKCFKLKFETKNIRFKYIRNPKNIGASLNLINLPLYSDAKYVWFLSDDDFVKVKSVSEFISVSNKNISFFYATRILADKDLNISELSLVQPCLNSNPNFYLNGFLMVKTLGLDITNILGFFSSIIIEKDLWVNNIFDTSIFGEFGYLCILFLAVKDKQCYILQEPCILCRLDYRGFNGRDSFVWIDSYLKTFRYAKEIGYDQTVCKKMTKSIMNSFAKSFIVAKSKGIRSGNLFQISKSILWYRYKPINIWFYLSLLPECILSAMYNFYFLKFRSIQNVKH
jgi:glycosyltransferase involved in cell wall biosynthesis